MRFQILLANRNQNAMEQTGKQGLRESSRPLVQLDIANEKQMNPKTKVQRSRKLPRCFRDRDADFSSAALGFAA